MAVEVGAVLAEGLAVMLADMWDFVRGSDAWEENSSVSLAGLGPSDIRTAP
jgi:hypothetical protein